MDEEIIEEFNEKFNSVEEALKYIADSQAKSEFIRKRDQAEFRKDVDEIKNLQAQTQKHLNHITKILRFTVEELEFQEDKLEKAGDALSRNEKNKTDFCKIIYG
jgi:hypothetical protein